MTGITEIEVGKLLGQLGIPVPARIGEGRVAITCSRYGADTLLSLGSGVYVLEEIGGRVILTLALSDLPTARGVINNEITELGDGYGSITESLRAILRQFDRLQADLVR